MYTLAIRSDLDANSQIAKDITNPSILAFSHSLVSQPSGAYMQISEIRIAHIRESNIEILFLN